MESFSHILIQFFRQKDFIFYLSLVISAAVVIAAEGLWRLRKAKPGASVVPNLPQDDSRLEFLWTVIPVFVLLCLASVQIDKIGGRAKAFGQLAARTLHLYEH